MKQPSARVRWTALLTTTLISLFAIFFVPVLVLLLLRMEWLRELLGIGGLTDWDKVLISGGVVTLAGVIVGLVLNYRKQRDAEDSKRNSEFAAAAAQLAGASASERIAGVHAMAAFADLNRELRQQCINVLCRHLKTSYLPRNNDIKTPEPSKNVLVTDPISQPPGEQEVRLAIIQTMRDRLTSDDKFSWQGYDFDFAGAVFDGGNFKGAHFAGSVVDFSAAVFTAKLVDFSEATFSAELVDFSGAHFGGERIDFSNVTFAAGRVDFSDARFAEGRVYFTAAEFYWHRPLFIDACFTGANVDFTGARFFAGCDFSRATFDNGRVDFTGVAFAGKRVFFTQAEFNGARVHFTSSKFLADHVSFSWTTYTAAVVNFTAAEFYAEHVAFNLTKFSERTSGTKSSRRSSYVAKSGVSDRRPEPYVNFWQAKFFRGDINFYDAEFRSGRVDLSNARSSGGTLDFSRIGERKQGVLKLPRNIDTPYIILPP